MWYLQRGVVLKKDNLHERNWQGSKKCSFCTHDETIEHLFFQCKFAHSTWSVIQIASYLYPSISVASIYGDWLNGIPNRFSTMIRVGSSALLWLLWLCRNYLVLISKNSTPLHVISHCMHWLRMWYILHLMEYQPLIKVVCYGQRGFHPTWMTA